MKQNNILKPINNLYCPSNILIKKRGRPIGNTRRIATSFINQYPKSRTISLYHYLQRQNHKLTYNYCLILHKRITNHTINNNSNNNPRNNNHNNNNSQNNKQNSLREIEHSQLFSNPILDVIYDYIKHKEAQNKPIINCINSLYPEGYTIVEPQFRYDNDYSLETLDRHGSERRFIERLRQQKTTIETSHYHNHNNKRERINYHVKDNDLGRFLCAYLGLTYPCTLYLYGEEQSNRHIISFDRSGLDLCCDFCIRKLMDTNLKTELEGLDLLKRCFPHGKLVSNNEVKNEW